MTKSKISLKLIISLAVAMLAICLFNTSTVSAVEITEEYAQQLLDLLPNEMSVNLKESEYQKVADVVEQKAKEIWTENNIDVSTLEYNIAEPMVSDKDYFYKSEIIITYYNGNNSYTLNKLIQITYNNSGYANSGDDEDVKSLKLQNPQYITIDFNDLKSLNSEIYDKMVLEAYSKHITDPDITLSLECYAGGGSLFIADDSLYGGDGGPYISIFKNDILYDVREIGCVPYVCQITIPDTVADNEIDFINYATPLISNYWKEIEAEQFGDEYVGNITLSKGATVDYWNINDSRTTETYNVENGYSIKGESGTVLGRVILKKAMPDGYKAEDEQIIKNLKLETPNYLAIDIKHCDDGEKMATVIRDYYNSIITDKSISTNVTAYSGGNRFIGSEYADSGVRISILKNDIVYDVRKIGCVPLVPAITIPNTEDDDINYAISIIKQYLKANRTEERFEVSKHIDSLTLTKGGTIDYNHYNGNLGTTKTFEVENGYTVKGLNGETLAVVILNKEAKKDIQETDEETNIKLDANTDVVPSDTILEVIEIKAEEILNKIVETLKDISNKFVVYDITLKSNGAEIQPNGKVKISIPIPEGYDKSKLVVFRIEDGNNIEYKVSVVTINNVEYAQFETDHFSNYLLAEKTVKEQQTPAEDNSNRVLDDEPKTGIIDMKFIVGIILVVSVIAIVRKQKKNG